MLGNEQLEHLHAHALARQLLEAGAGVDAGGEALWVGSALAIGGVEAEEPQDAQIVFGDARRRVADEAHAPRLDVGEPADVVVDGSVAGERQRVHGEVAPLGVALPVAPELDRCAAAERLDVLAQGRDLERAALDHHRDGAVVEPGRHGLEACSLDPADHFGRERGSGDIDVAVRLADERVAHRAADDAGFLAVVLERGENAAQRRLSQPFGIEAAPSLRHFVSPGTNCPSSIWAGT